jgi:hypothetical protein
VKLLDIDLKGLPRIDSVSVYALDMPTVDAMLAVPNRRGVERWAKRLGVEVTDTLVPGTTATRHIAAVRERSGVRLEVWVRIRVPGPDGGA